ncbi:hypothetical protein [Capnocytophaga canimorsus]|uniref:hypothetical protein n=1 Tax=Capnocytophaga canimorsus TaxID=28188 RepID=UPI001BB37F2F|nr:hypothetical protein [Capnocytophaga canimorsus]
MKTERFKILVNIWVLCCYFLALTPVHSLWHWATEEAHHCSEVSHAHPSDDESSTCNYCDFILSEQTKHLEAVIASFDFSIKWITSPTTLPNYYQELPHKLILGCSSLRAPPIC